MSRKKPRISPEVRKDRQYQGAILSLKNQLKKSKSPSEKKLLKESIEAREDILKRRRKDRKKRK